MKYEPGGHPPPPTNRAPIASYAVIRGNTVLVVGRPGIYGWLAEDDALQHNCDAMGCSSVEHVIARVPLDRATVDGEVTHE